MQFTGKSENKNVHLKMFVGTLFSDTFIVSKSVQTCKNDMAHEIRLHLRNLFDSFRWSGRLFLVPLVT